MYVPRYKLVLLMTFLFGYVSSQEVEEAPTSEPIDLFNILKEAGYARIYFDETDFVSVDEEEDNGRLPFIAYTDDEPQGYSQIIQNLAENVGSQEFIDTAFGPSTSFENFKDDAEQDFCNFPLPNTLRNQFTAVGVIQTNSSGKSSYCMGVLLDDIKNSKNIVVSPGNCVNQTNQEVSYTFRSALLNKEFSLQLKNVTSYKESNQQFDREFALFTIKDARLDVNRITLERKPTGNCSFLIVGVDAQDLAEGSSNPYKLIPCPNLLENDTRIDWGACGKVRCNLNDLGILSGAAITLSCEGRNQRRRAGEVFLLGLSVNVFIDDQFGHYPFLFNQDIDDFTTIVDGLASD